MDSGYIGRMRFTVIDMGSQDYIPGKGDAIVTMLLFALPSSAQQDWLQRRGGRPAGPPTQDDLDRLSADFLDVDKRAREIAQREVRDAELDIKNRQSRASIITATAPEELVEVAGRVCSMSFGENQSPRTNAEYVRRLIEMGHESVLEHVSWTFLLTGVSRAFTHQLVRHRVGFAFSQLSQQYHDETDADFVVPSLLRKAPKALAAWQRAIQVCQEAYREIAESVREVESDAELELQKKEARRAMRSAARSILPNATATKIVVTANARALRYFLKIRGSIPGDEEMRKVAAELLKYLQKEAPSLFFDFHIDTLPDGSPIVRREEVTAGSA